MYFMIYQLDQVYVHVSEQDIELARDNVAPM